MARLAIMGAGGLVMRLSGEERRIYEEAVALINSEPTGAHGRGRLWLVWEQEDEKGDEKGKEGKK